MKKGFTLIELLSVIIILAIILVIVVPRVLNAIDKSKANVNISNNKMVLKSAELFVANNTSYLPGEVGNTNEITIQTLIDNNVLKEFKLGNNNCSGYVLITKINETDYDYTPHINCEEQINNSEEDGLVAHYKFNDFQEPTVNLSLGITPIFSAWGTPAVTGTSGYFDTPSGSSGVYANIVYNGSGGVFWRRTNNDIAINVLPSTQYTVSAIIKWSESSNPSPNLFYLRQYRTDNSQVTESGHYSSSFTIPLGNNWFKAYRTFTTTAETTTIRLQSYQYSTIELWMYDFQIEQKPYFTPYVDSIREGIVKDYSKNSYTSNLQPTTTPKWILENNSRKGVYEFSKNTDVIPVLGALTGVYSNQQYSWGAWVKLDSTFNSAGRILMSQTNVLELSISASRTVHATTRDVGGYKQTPSSSPLTLNTWHHIFATCDGIITKLFINGEYISQVVSSGFINPSNNIYIGNWSSNQVFKGLVDDVMIYNRALSETEIEKIYQVTK